MAKPDTKTTHDGYRPITEGYQPGQGEPLAKGYIPTAGSAVDAQQTPPSPPSGGSSAAKPAQK
jgi:hypothetical protein